MEYLSYFMFDEIEWLKGIGHEDSLVICFSKSYERRIALASKVYHWGILS